MSVRLVVRGVALALVTLSATSLVAGAQATSTSSTSTTVANPVVKIAKIPIPGKPLKAFDISWVDPTAAKLYLADRSNAAVDVFDVTTNANVAQIGGFVGATGNNDTSGPDGIVVTVSGRELWAGDGDSTAKVVDLAAGKVVASISTGGKARADELAYDPQHGLILIANDADDPPFLTFINVAARSVVAKIDMPEATDGLEQPFYDAQTGMFYQAVPATTTNEGGEIAVLDPVKMSIVNRYPLNNCNPAGLVGGPAGTNQLLAGCAKSHILIIDKTTGKTMADVTQTGGPDEVWFNSGDNRYYLGESRAQNLGVIDASTMTFVQNVQSGVGAHSVAADSVSNHIFVPIAAPDPACPNGCIAVYTGATSDRGGMPR